MTTHIGDEQKLDIVPCYAFTFCAKKIQRLEGKNKYNYMDYDLQTTRWRCTENPLKHWIVYY